MSAIHRASLFVASTVLLVGCSSSVKGTDAPDAAVDASEGVSPPGDGGTGDGGASTPEDAGTVAPEQVAAAVDAFDAALANAVCQRLATCCAAADYAAYFQQFAGPPYDLTTAPSASECASSLSATLGKLHKKWAGSAKLGRITFSATRAKSCVAGVTAAACGVPLTTALFDAACFGTRGNEVFTKVTPLGAACADIKDGTFFGECDPKLGFCGSGGTCEAWRKSGQDCGFVPTRMFCAPSLTCEGGSPSKPGKCSGEPIARSLGESCGAISGPLEVCAAGTYCDDVSGLCAATKPNGAKCKTDEECTTSHPYSCTPFGNGTCGKDTFCRLPGTP